MPHMAEARNIEDDWAGITNTAARKRRQNRLNQRALRRRREAEKSASSRKEFARTAQSGLPLSIERQADYAAPYSSHPINPNLHSPRIAGQQIVLSPQSKLQSSNSSPKSRWGSEEEGALLVVSVGPTTVVLDLYSCPLPADHLLTLVRYNLYRACAANAEILGLDPRSLHDDIPSPFCDHATFNRPLPASLIPTETQISVQHPPYIDLCPFPSLRDKLILLQGTIDEDELCADIGGHNSTVEHNGLIAWGDPWDPMAWELSEYAAMKWGPLIGRCDELIIATNYWRRRRGETPLLHALFRSR
ncbi:hypothetical protein F4777DRAFT_578465 [Nemania sp. FL0916]|nr:hypothetical protein F4777DRAFT_578465 [Nemania sp. FL0916]